MPDTTAFEKMELDGWSQPSTAAGYAKGFSNASRFMAQRLADAVSAGPDMEVLDLCCGPGLITAELLSRGARVTGLDFSEAMIELARVAAPDARIVQGDAMALEFPDATFDAVTIGYGVPHFPDTMAGLKQAARVLKPGGRIAFSIWEGKGSNGAFGWLFDAVGRLGDPTVSLPEGPDAHQLADDATARDMVGEAGFRDIASERVATELDVPQPEALFDAFDRGAVRAASLLSGQSSDLRNAIRADLAARVRREGEVTGDGYRVAAPSVVVSAARI
ncbi:class I SAM-dependent methyltransferase [Amaricoccus tamworthensis]|uniref:class I SAM-dependent methyltransferase n=1 Tax=Amaricoccus tamworthensis TaxID=57002 RepID=UPI003C7C597C